MARGIEETTVTPDDRDGTRHAHPAFAQIAASRASGHEILYGSDFVHQHFVTIRISGSEMHRSLSRDWVCDRREYIEVELSEAQWASFVSSMNVGGGVPCTLRHLKGEQIPGLPDPISRRDQFSGEVRETLNDALKALDALAAEVDGLKVSDKQKAALRARVAKSRQEIEANVPFVLKSFGQHVEHTVEKAKIEINAYATATVMRAGIAALNGSELPAIEYRDGAK